MGLTKRDSLCLKGISIIIMMFHHLYCSTNRFADYDVNFEPFTQNQIVNLALYFKICVSIFVFITGYGLYKSICKTEFNKNSITKWGIDRYIKTLSGFWFIYIIAFVVTMIINKYPVEIFFEGSRLRGLTYMAFDFLGLANLFSTPTLCGTWWYMSAAIVFIFCVPLIFKIKEKIGYLPIIVVVTALPRVLKVGYPGTVNLFTFMLILIFGMMCAECNTFEKISEIFKKNKLIYVVSIVVLAAIILASIRLLYVVSYEKAWELQLNFIPILFIILCRYTVVRIPIVNNALEFIGKHSMTIFLTHTFIRYNYLTDLIYNQKSFIISFFLLLGLAIILAVVIDTFKSLIKFDKLVEKGISTMNKKFFDK